MEPQVASYLFILNHGDQMYTLYPALITVVSDTNAIYICIWLRSSWYYTSVNYLSSKNLKLFVVAVRAFQV